MAEPTIEQLARFACLRIYGPGWNEAAERLAVSMLSHSAHIEAGWRKAHADFQAALAPSTGDES